MPTTNGKHSLRDWGAEKSRNSQVSFCKLCTNAFGAGSVFVCLGGGGAAGMGGAIQAPQDGSCVLVSAH